MAGRIGDLLVTLRADVATFRSDMGKAVSVATSNSKAIERAVGGAGKAIRQLLAVAGAGTIGASIKSVISLGDQYNRLSKTAGIGVEAFQEVAYAAKQSDVELSSLGESLGRFQRNLSENGKGTAEALAAIGVSTAQLKGQGVDRQLETVADGIARLTDPAEKSRAAVALFGKSGAALLPLFEQGASGIRLARQEARDLGLVMSGEGVDALSAYDSQLKKLTGSYTALVQTAVTSKPGGLIGDLLYGARSVLGGKTEIEKFNDAIDFLETARRRGKGIFEAGFGGVGFDVGFQSAQDVERKIVELQAQRDALIRERRIAAGLGFRGRGIARESGPKAPGFADDAAAALAKARAEAEAFQRVIEGVTRDVNGLVNAMNETVNGDSILSAETMYEQVQAERELAAAAVEAREALVSAAKDAVDPTREVTRRYAELREAILATIATLPEGSAKVGELQRTLGELAKREAEDIRSTGSELTVFADQAARNIQDSFADFLFDPFKGGLRGMLTGFLTTLRRMAAEAAAASIFKSLFGGNKGGGLGSTIGAFFGSFFGGGKATGGGVQGGTSYLVGERGPEMLTMGRGQSGFVTPNNQLGGPAQVFNVTQNISGLGLPAEQVFQVVARANKQLARDLGAANRRAGLPEPRW